MSTSWLLAALTGEEEEQGSSPVTAVPHISVLWCISVPSLSLCPRVSYDPR